MSASAEFLNGANPLLPLVLQLLRETPDGISEYDLLKKIEATGNYFSALSTQPDRDDDDARLALFQKHFLVMNALYRLQDTLWREENLWLSISPLRIALDISMNDVDETNSANNNIASYGGNALRDYYLDWNQLIGTDSAAVTELLSAFWRRYAAHDGRAEALAVLQLDSEADNAAVKRQYRRLAAVTHPDRGGDAAQFLAIRAAYEILCGI